MKKFTRKENYMILRALLLLNKDRSLSSQEGAIVRTVFKEFDKDRDYAEEAWGRDNELLERGIK